LLQILLNLCAIPSVVYILAYAFPYIVSYFKKVPDFKKKYPGAKWALVTGGGSGIGKGIVFGLAKQGEEDDKCWRERVEEGGRVKRRVEGC